jgi:hypothetical protein
MGGAGQRDRALTEQEKYLLSMPQENSSYGSREPELQQCNFNASVRILKLS